ncbi:FAD-binding and (Fe-S)-binding domain-containing protein [Lentiprolixibacter aurantiacus]|uniref:FAD-binding protein n=1 Tax=Lentiprolixibacter aurantiacus TaxID=2993939 RepID=A0AAE3SNI4_9FLAO|nr:FAD-binding and (Fe-S)-binding domain-containing protein [Lentiprolixibacter aurantiacus]MCX2719669.1 FAD-binding protein [Lentiprolixibacter aurantiacus]
MQKNLFTKVSNALEGTIHWDDLSRKLYATDASVYRMVPEAVAYPKSVADIQLLVHFASEHKIGLIPRTAGTSLAGQCVGEGIVVDVSRHMTSILDLDLDKKQIRVQPGVIRDELNQYLAPYGLYFGPNTSTSNRCMIGGMVGNNSSGTTSIQYGVTRDKVVALKTVLSDGSEVEFKALYEEEFIEKCKLPTLEGKLYSNLFDELSQEEIREEIRSGFPKPTIHRRNTGYAVDELLKSSIFGGHERDINLGKLLCGSEGTLAFTTEITLQLDDLPPPLSAMVVTHYSSLENCLSDVVPVMRHNLQMCEMMDKVILDCTKSNRQQLANRFFVQGDPEALLMLQLSDSNREGLERQIADLIQTIGKSGFSYAHPVLYGEDINKAIELRKAGLGLLGNMVGDKKAVACIEDTAVALEDLKDFIGEFTAIMKGYDQKAVYYAHAGAGELHLRPILDLKKSGDVSLFREITTDVARLTKKYRGSFSGEHGDGIVRAEFIPMMIGNKNYGLLRRIKGYFDPQHIFNPGKIVDAFPMDKSLRYETDREEPVIATLMDFSDTQGILRAAEQCNGSGDCRKTHNVAGTMCPSYQATRNERDTTRARANTLREILTHNSRENPFDSDELKTVLDLCLSCKACSRECPSNVDIASMKAEFLYQYQETHGYSFRSRLFANNYTLNKWGSMVPGLTNWLYANPITGNLIKKISGVARERSLPEVSSFNYKKHLKSLDNKEDIISDVVLFIDEFTENMDAQIGKDAIDLLHGLGYKVHLFFGQSGRAQLSKGFLKQVKKLAIKNLEGLYPYVSRDMSVLGLEPSAVLTFRDEYKRMGMDQEKVGKLASKAFLIEEFLAEEIIAGRIDSGSFTRESKQIKIHNHCHQKALSNQKVTFDILNLPENYEVSIISSGCCGMAGSFGYEEEHYEVSMKTGELKLFPAIRNSADAVIAANGTSCRHQIKDGTGREAKHPVSILREALISD